MKFDNNILKRCIKIEYNTDENDFYILNSDSNDSGIIMINCVYKSHETYLKEYYIRIEQYNNEKIKLRNNKLKSL